jgi:hypothetical protein
MSATQSPARQAANYFWAQADYWRRQGDSAYADRCDQRAGQWAQADR